jgi:hypothetical protein
MPETDFPTSLHAALLMLPIGPNTTREVVSLLVAHIARVKETCLNAELCHHAEADVEKANWELVVALEELSDTETILAPEELPPVAPFELELPEPPDVPGLPPRK